MTRGAFLLAIMLLALPASSRAQGQLTFRGFGDAGMTVFSATQSFKAILGTSSGPVFGGGVEVGLTDRLFVSLAASRFRRTGHRVFIFNDQLFTLDVADTITVTPLELTGGYRFGRLGILVPYAGGGIGWHRFEETSAHAVAGDDVKLTKTGFHVLGGAEVPIRRWLSAGVDAQFSAVPNAFGDEPTSVSRHYDEHDLGGFTLRAKIIVGR